MRKIALIISCVAFVVALYAAISISVSKKHQRPPQTFHPDRVYKLPIKNPYREEQANDFKRKKVRGMKIGEEHIEEILILSKGDHSLIAIISDKEIINEDGFEVVCVP